MTFRDLFSTKFVYTHRSKKMSILFPLLLAGCLLFNPVPDAFGFLFTYNLEKVNTLTKHLHKDYWVIKYRYADDCPEEVIKEAEFPEAVTIALQTWLQPLREYTDRPIVNDFRVELHAGLNHGDADLYCIIHGPTTDERLSYARVRFLSGPLVGILLRDSKEFGPRFKFALLHEVGHAFGLGDVYIIGWNVSTGGLAGTAGKHPPSIMSGHLRNQDFSANMWPLSRDDQGGVIMAYKIIHEGLSYKACETVFTDYHYTETRNPGCEPKHPLLDALKYSEASIVAQMLRDDGNLEVNGQDEEGMTPLVLAMLKGYREIATELVSREDIDVNRRDPKTGNTALVLAMLKGYREIATELVSREDIDVNRRDPKTGNTALHLAVLDNDTDFIKALLAHPKIKVNIHNKETRTPAQLARHLKRFPLTVVIQKHPTAKLFPWSVTSKGKLATTWGHLKQRD